MKKEKYISWEAYFMSVAIISSFRSKDKKTQTGSCIINRDKKIVGVGYNGLPRGLDDNNKQFWTDSDDANIYTNKHTYVIHAEQNAIHNKISQDLKGSTIYISLFPCKECTKSIIQVGISKVIYLDIKPHHEQENKAVKLMLKSAGVELIAFNSLKIPDKDFILKLRDINSYYN